MLISVITAATGHMCYGLKKDLLLVSENFMLRISLLLSSSIPDYLGRVSWQIDVTDCRLLAIWLNKLELFQDHQPYINLFSNKFNIHSAIALTTVTSIRYQRYFDKLSSITAIGTLVKIFFHLSMYVRMIGSLLFQFYIHAIIE